MDPITKEWVAKAEGDWISAQREYRARKSPNYDASCFHAQQCVEKSLKACLHESKLPCPKTHDLLMLLSKIPRQDVEWLTLLDAAARLNAYSVGFRYPGEFADREMAKEALQDAALVREKTLSFLKIKGK